MPACVEERLSWALGGRGQRWWHSDRAPKILKIHSLLRGCFSISWEYPSFVLAGEMMDAPTVENLDGFLLPSEGSEVAQKLHPLLGCWWCLWGGNVGSHPSGVPTGWCWTLLYPTQPVETLRLVKLKLFPGPAFSRAIFVKES